jgi:2-C-methyl-D-erythritol 4-phosphate cytidylyltransferase
MPTFALILPAAGRSVRFGADKLMGSLAGRPVLAHSLGAFLRRTDVAAVVIPCRAGPEADPFADAPEDLRHMLADPRIRFCAGGDSRAASVYNGVRSLPEEIEWVAVHDAARPLVSQELIARTLAAAEAHGAAVPALPVHLTIKQADGPLPARVQHTVPRSSLWAMQTPQVMNRAELLSAFAACPLPLDLVTDDAQILELSGREVWLVAGEERNLKITTALDLRIAEMLMDDSGRGAAAT